MMDVRFSAISEKKLWAWKSIGYLFSHWSASRHRVTIIEQAYMSRVSGREQFQPWAKNIDSL